MIGVTLCVPVLAIAVSVFAQSVSKRDQTLQECARLVARYHLLRHHWQLLETDSEFRPVIDAMFNDTLAGPHDALWTRKIVRFSEVDSAEVSDFERVALKRLEAGEDEVAEFSRKEGFRYVCAVRLKDSCLSCHPIRPGQPTNHLKPGDVIAFVSLKRESPAGTK